MFSYFSARGAAVSQSLRTWSVSHVRKAGVAFMVAASTGRGACDVVVVHTSVPAAVAIVVISVVAPHGEGEAAVLADALAWPGVGNFIVFRAVVCPLVRPLVLATITVFNWLTLLWCNLPQTWNVYLRFVTNVTRTAAFRWRSSLILKLDGPARPNSRAGW